LVSPCLWKEAGFFMIFYLAALQQIPPQLGEAAALKGASRFYFFRRVQFPLLMPTTLFCDERGGVASPDRGSAGVFLDRGR
jgi:sn-glycerol 3-phosphate transport system permease protein